MWRYVCGCVLVVYVLAGREGEGNVIVLSSRDTVACKTDMASANFTLWCSSQSDDASGAKGCRLQSTDDRQEHRNYPLRKDSEMIESRTYVNAAKRYPDVAVVAFIFAAGVFTVFN
jgi:hypothetical protein